VFNVSECLAQSAAAKSIWCLLMFAYGHPLCHY